jgi:hypothetical protein
MRKPMLLLMLSVFVVPALAAKRISVEQLEQIVATAHGKPDTKAAQQLYELELTERLSAARLMSAQSNLPGPASRQALLAIADASAFLDLPAADTPANPAPDSDTQAALWDRTMDYASQTIARLPNFFATRDTIRFEDTPSEPPHNTTDTIKYAPLHPVGSATATVLYRDGHEFIDTGNRPHKSFDPSDFELSAAGEFGPILATVLADSEHNGLTWSHWEQGPAGLMAVFRYSVSKEGSHYTVTFPNPDQDKQILPGYHGEIGINPQDGSILRLTMVADLKPVDPGTTAGLMVEYGPVEIGGNTYICPVKSVALSLVWIMHGESNAMTGEHTSRGPLQTRVNHVAFKQYHLFRAEMRIVSDDAAVPPGAVPPTPRH